MNIIKQNLSCPYHQQALTPLRGVASRAIPRRRRAAGDVDGARRLEWQDGGRTGAPLRAMGRQMEREDSRGGESKAKALAGAGRGAVRAQRGGPRRPCAERHTREWMSAKRPDRRTRPRRDG